MLNDYTYVTELLPKSFLIPEDHVEDFVLASKKQMLCKLVEDHPAQAYEQIVFETKINENEIHKAIEFCFKRSDGQYFYHGQFVSREYLWDHFKECPWILVMRVRAYETALCKRTRRI